MKHFISKTQKIGEIGEEKACIFLEKQGFSIIERNVSNRFGEIDIIARRGGTFHFFEVKTGKEGSFVNPAENLTKDKLRKLFISVEHYCLLKGIRQYDVKGLIVILGREQSSAQIIDLS